MPFLTRSVFKSIICLLIVAASSLPALANWRVIPIRLDFDQRNRSGVITLSNDGDDPLSFTVDAVEWSQDETGRDVYTPAKDLIFFPKGLTIPAREERIIRAGIRTPAISKEKTYRLLIKEASSPGPSDGTAVAIAIQFGVPVFAHPVKEDLKGELSTALSSDGSQIEASVSNQGNAHFRIKTITFSGKNDSGQEIWRQEIAGWYLLSGSARTFSSSLPAEVCPSLTTIDIQADASKLKLDGKLDVDPSVCPTP